MTAGRGLKRRVEAVGGPDQIQPGIVEYPGEEVVGSVFLKTQFRLCVNPMGGCGEGVGQLVDPVEDPLSCMISGHRICHGRIVQPPPGPVRPQRGGPFLQGQPQCAGFETYRDLSA